MTAGFRIRAQRNRTATVLIATTTAVVSTGIGVAWATDAGGLGSPAPPEATDARCVQRCLDLRTVTETGKVEITGRRLGGVVEVRLGSTRIEPRRVSDSSVRFVVPEGAESGRPRVFDEFGNRSAAPVEIEVRRASAISEATGFSVRRARAIHSKSFFKSRRPSGVEYLFEAEEPTDVRIDVLAGRERKLVDSIVQSGQAPFETHTARWSGLNQRGKVAKNGRYRFRVTPLAGGSGSGAGFEYYNHTFPVPARHTYGDGFGAGRGHRGQDIFARCGVKVVAARAGTVRVRRFHRAAGHYVVISGAKTGYDYVYMHLARRGRPKQGSRVRTGQVIGYNSDTGNASGCHLHFELWSAPGWYEGGRAVDPARIMRRWDRWS